MRQVLTHRPSAARAYFFRGGYTLVLRVPKVMLNFSERDIAICASI